MNKEQQKKLIVEIMRDDEKDGLYNNMTAVEYIERAIDKYMAYHEGNHKAELFTISDLREADDKAKQMEKQQIVEAARWEPFLGEMSEKVGEQYYREKYGNSRK